MTTEEKKPVTPEEALNIRREAVNRALWSVGIIAGQDKNFTANKEIDPHYEAAFNSLKSLQQQLEKAAGV